MVIIVQSSFALDRRNSVAKTATGLDLSILVIQIEYRLMIIIIPARVQTYTGKKNYSHVCMYISIPSKKQTWMSKSKLIQAANTLDQLDFPGGKMSLFTAMVFA